MDVQIESAQYLSGTNDEAEISNLRINHSQEGGDDEMPLTKGPTTRAMARGYKRNEPPMHIQGPRWTLHGPRKMWRPSLRLFVCKY